MWAWGWVLILLHFGIRLLEEWLRIPHQLTMATDLILLLFAGISFAVSSSPMAEYAHFRNRLFLLLGTPAVVISFVVAFNPKLWLISAFAAAVMYFGTIGFLASRTSKRSPAALALYFALAVSGLYSIVQALRGDTDFPALMMLAWLFLVAGLLFANTYRRWSTGVILTALGFAGWSAVWALVAFFPGIEVRLGQFNEFWNVPKYILAFGMIVVLLEDEQIIVHSTRERERGLTQQLESFAEVTSRLLGGQDVRTLCGQIATIITKVTTFQRVVVHLADEQQHFQIAGSAGVSNEVLAQVSKASPHITAEVVAKLADMGRKVGRSSFICSREQMSSYGAVSGKADFGFNPFWQAGDELVVPIRTPRGTNAGFLSLDEPRELGRVNSAEMAQLEQLADDLGVAIDRAYLQRELIRSEKLAGIGQLVAGMAHELNNPLTAVLGYAEMMGDTGTDPQVRQQAGIIQRESLRMKRIIENLIRFSKQEKGERRLISITESLEEVLKLWTYQARNRQVQLDIHVEKDLPMIQFDETQLKQVLLNILSNAFEAVETSERKLVTVRAETNHGIVTVTVSDSGSGFSEPERVFDPFFTTKGVGKGTGLGLSVCYGIVKQHGGDIRAFNVQPRGAGITLEFPVAQQELALTSESAAS
jgi:two-component system NtrC family sensor kinase